MATVTVFDPTTRNNKTITVDMGAAVVIQDLDSETDYYVRMYTSATKLNGSAISTAVLRTLEDGAGTSGTTKHDGTALPYGDFTEAITDHIRRIVEGDLVDAQTAMSFA